MKNATFNFIKMAQVYKKINKKIFLTFFNDFFRDFAIYFLSSALYYMHFGTKGNVLSESSFDKLFKNI
jgi:hypothetical protein